MWPSGCGYLSESLEVEDQYVRQCPECDLLSGVLLLVFAVWTVPRVLSVQLSVCVGGREGEGREGGRREGGGREGKEEMKGKTTSPALGAPKQDELLSVQKQTGN